jgi:hypothetical protein
VDTTIAGFEARGTSGPRWPKIFLFLTAVLSSTILLKVGQVQYLELLYFVQLSILLVAFAKADYRARWFRPYYRIGACYVVFSLLALALALASLRYDFYYPDELGMLKYPVVIGLSRIVELLASVFIMLYLAAQFRSDVKKAIFMMRVYFWAGFASGIFSILSFPLNLAGIDLGTYSVSHRMRGFYNEGGPYGVYVFSVVLVGVALYKLGWEKKGRLWFAFAILSVAFLGSQSKAAIVAVVALFLLNILMVQSATKLLALLAAVIIFLVAAFQVVDIGAGLRIYQRSSQAYERASYQHPEDGNFVYGRVAGAFIVPRMIGAHPLTGIGWGNYGILRNAPEYRGASIWVNKGDDPGLGLLGTAAEIGLPLLFYLLACLALPYIYLRRIKAPLYLTNLALLQPIAHVCGAQLNLTYPWIVTAFAIGVAYSFVKPSKTPVDELILSPST